MRTGTAGPRRAGPVGVGARHSLRQRSVQGPGRVGCQNGEMDLRLRVAAQIPLVGDGLRVTGAGRARILAALQHARLNGVLLALAARYGLAVGTLEWDETPEPAGHNNSRFAAYQAPVTGAGGQRAVLGSFVFSL